MSINLCMNNAVKRFSESLTKRLSKTVTKIYIIHGNTHFFQKKLNEDELSKVSKYRTGFNNQVIIDPEKVRFEFDICTVVEMNMAL